MVNENWKLIKSLADFKPGMNSAVKVNRLPMTSQSKDYYFKHKDDSGYIEKYKSGKNFYDSVIEDRYLKILLIILLIVKVDVLEIGYFLEELIINCEYYKNIATIFQTN